jgi:outer membrane protein assembly factor BamB
VHHDSAYGGGPIAAGSTLVTFDQAQHPQGLTKRNGKVTWKSDVRSLPLTTAAGGGYVYTIGEDRRMHALDAGTGELKWSIDLPDATNFRTGDLRSYFVGPLVLVRYSTDELIAFSSIDGTEIWRIAAPNLIYATGTASGVLLVEAIDSTNSRLRLVRFEDGGSVWQVLTAALSLPEHTADDQFAGLTAAPPIALTPRDSSTVSVMRADSGTVVWSHDVDACCSVRATASRVVLVDAESRTIRAWDAANGRRRWQRRLPDLDGASEQVASADVVVVAPVPP